MVEHQCFGSIFPTHKPISHTYQLLKTTLGGCTYGPIQAKTTIINDRNNDGNLDLPFELSDEEPSTKEPQIDM